MATILEQYLQLKSATGEQMASGTLPCDKVFTYQEILYRISVLESCQAFCKTAPITTDTKVLCYHYQIVDGYLCSLLSEHKVGFPANDELKAKRKAASDSLTQIVQNCRKSFSSFKPTSPELYKQSVNKLVNTVLPAWVQYRNTYINLK